MICRLCRRPSGGYQLGAFTASLRRLRHCHPRPPARRTSVIWCLQAGKNVAASHNRNRRFPRRLDFRGLVTTGSGGQAVAWDRLAGAVAAREHRRPLPTEVAVAGSSPDRVHSHAKGGGHPVVRTRALLRAPPSTMRFWPQPWFGLAALAIAVFLMPRSTTSMPPRERRKSSGGGFRCIGLKEPRLIRETSRPG
jgi:hypothetical protein